MENEEIKKLEIKIDELSRQVAALSDAQQVQYTEILTHLKGTHDDRSEDDLYHEAVEIIEEWNSVSTSLLQRTLGIGYNKAVRLMDKLEEEGIVGPSHGSAPREILKKNSE